MFALTLRFVKYSSEHILTYLNEHRGKPSMKPHTEAVPPGDMQQKSEVCNTEDGVLPTKENGRNACPSTPSEDEHRLGEKSHEETCEVPSQENVESCGEGNAKTTMQNMGDDDQADKVAQVYGPKLGLTISPGGATEVSTARKLEEEEEEEIEDKIPSMLNTKSSEESLGNVFPIHEDKKREDREQVLDHVVEEGTPRHSHDTNTVSDVPLDPKESLIEGQGALVKGTRDQDSAVERAKDPEDAYIPVIGRLTETNKSEAFHDETEGNTPALSSPCQSMAKTTGEFQGESIEDLSDLQQDIKECDRDQFPPSTEDQTTMTGDIEMDRREVSMEGTEILDKNQEKTQGNLSHKAEQGKEQRTPDLAQKATCRVPSQEEVESCGEGNTKTTIQNMGDDDQADKVAQVYGPKLGLTISPGGATEVSTARKLEEDKIEDKFPSMLNPESSEESLGELPPHQDKNKKDREQVLEHAVEEGTPRHSQDTKTTSDVPLDPKESLIEGQGALVKGTRDQDSAVERAKDPEDACIPVIGRLTETNKSEAVHDETEGNTPALSSPCQSMAKTTGEFQGKNIEDMSDLQQDIKECDRDQFPPSTEDQTTMTGDIEMDRREVSMEGTEILDENKEKTRGNLSHKAKQRKEQRTPDLAQKSTCRVPSQDEVESCEKGNTKTTIQNAGDDDQADKVAQVYGSKLGLTISPGGATEVSTARKLEEDKIEDKIPSMLNPESSEENLGNLFPRQNKKDREKVLDHIVDEGKPRHSHDTNKVFDVPLEDQKEFLIEGQGALVKGTRDQDITVEQAKDPKDACIFVTGKLTKTSNSEAVNDETEGNTPALSSLCQSMAKTTEEFQGESIEDLSDLQKDIKESGQDQFPPSTEDQTTMTGDIEMEGQEDNMGGTQIIDENKQKALSNLSHEVQGHGEKIKEEQKQIGDRFTEGMPMPDHAELIIATNYSGGPKQVKKIEASLPVISLHPGMDINQESKSAIRVEQQTGVDSPSQNPRDDVIKCETEPVIQNKADTQKKYMRAGKAKGEIHVQSSSDIIWYMCM